VESLRLARGEKVQSGAVRRSPRWVAHTTAATAMVLVDVAGWISSSLLLPLQQGQALPVAQLVCGQQGTARYATTHTKLIQTHSSETATIECVPTDCGHCPIEHAALQTGGELVTLRQKVQKARCKKDREKTLRLVGVCCGLRAHVVGCSCTHKFLRGRVRIRIAARE
jgi:hypothetical protein